MIKITHSGYYPGGMPLPGRQYSSDKFRYGFNGQEKDDEVYGNGNLNTAQFCEYDTRLIRRWNVDPVVKHSWNSYNCFSSNPIFRMDSNGDHDYSLDKKGNLTLTKKTDAKDHTIIAGENKINLAKEFIDEAIISEDKKKNEKVSFFISKDVEKTEEIYKFFATNTDVEWDFSVFENKSKVAVISSTHDPSHIKLYVADFKWKVLEGDKNIKMIRCSHSHPRIYNPKTGYPAYPSGFKNDGTIDFSDVGDRDVVENFDKQFHSRQPQQWEIFVPTAPKLKIMYDQLLFKVDNKE